MTCHIITMKKKKKKKNYFNRGGKETLCGQNPLAIRVQYNTLRSEGQMGGTFCVTRGHITHTQTPKCK